jgi:hypothetical protein
MVRMLLMEMKVMSTLQREGEQAVPECSARWGAAWVHHIVALAHHPAVEVSAYWHLHYLDHQLEMYENACLR